MNRWYVNIRLTCLNGDGAESFVVEADTPGQALDYAIASLDKLGGGLIGWNVTGLGQFHSTYLRQPSTVTTAHE